ncbi:hypothetical protein F4775DRAFT_274036 [Biscogniauxia sp. FL1348]|nr:hypothetical protein F4775DRAFT_274036 [Biscogniauxia sp. FL1348]
MTSEPRSGKLKSSPTDMIDNGEGHQDDPTETTPLTGAGAGQDEASSRNGEPRREAWVGSEDFEGWPWWRRPSVRWQRESPGGFGADSGTRSTGWYHHIFYLLLRSEVSLCQS